MEEGEAQKSEFPFRTFFCTKFLLCTSLYGSDFIRAWEKSLRWKRWPCCLQHVQSTKNHFLPSSQWSHWGQWTCPSPSLQRDLHECFRCPTAELKPKVSVILLWQSDFYIYIYSQTLLLLSTHNHLSSLTAHSTAWTSTPRARIIKPTVLRHTIWVHANITIPFETLMPRGQFTRTLRGAIRSLTQRVSVSHFKIVLRPKGAIRHAGLTPCSRFLLSYLSINPHNSYLTRTCLPQILPVLACKRKNPSPPRHSLH